MSLRGMGAAILPPIPLMRSDSEDEGVVGKRKRPFSCRCTLSYFCEMGCQRGYSSCIRVAEASSGSAYPLALGLIPSQGTYGPARWHLAWIAPSLLRRAPWLNGGSQLG